MLTEFDAEFGPQHPFGPNFTSDGIDPEREAQVLESWRTRPDRPIYSTASRRARLTWAKLIRRVYEVDPLLCPFSGAEMKILAFIVDFGAAKGAPQEPGASGPGARAPVSRASGEVRAHRRVRLSLWLPVPTPGSLGHRSTEGRRRAARIDTEGTAGRSGQEWPPNSCRSTSQLDSSRLIISLKSASSRIESKWGSTEKAG